MEAPTNLLVRGHNVKKVVDYRLDNGKRFYKVKWESTWEPEDSLLKFQNLVDQFWGFVNRVKSEDDRYPMKKRPKLLTDHEKENSDSRYVEYTDHISSEAASIRDDGSTPTYQKQVYDETIEPKNDPNRLKALAEISQQNIPSIHNSPIGNRDGADDSKQGETEGEAIENNEKILPGGSANKPRKTAPRNTEKLFFCRLCSRGFTRRDMCVRHERVHTKDFCYFCAVCEQGFMRRYVLMNHLKRLHNTMDVNLVLSTKKPRRESIKKNSSEPLKSELDTVTMQNMSANHLQPSFAIAHQIDEDSTTKRENNVVSQNDISLMDPDNQPGCSDMNIEVVYRVDEKGNLDPHSYQRIYVQQSQHIIPKDEMGEVSDTKSGMMISKPANEAMETNDDDEKLLTHRELDHEDEGPNFTVEEESNMKFIPNRNNISTFCSSNEDIGSSEISSRNETPTIVINHPDVRAGKRESFATFRIVNSEEQEEEVSVENMQTILIEKTEIADDNSQDEECVQDMQTILIEKGDIEDVGEVLRAAYCATEQSTPLKQGKNEEGELVAEESYIEQAT